MNRQRSTRSSRGSNSTNDSDPREKMKDCCRKLAAFMFTQVGVGAVIVGYALCGAYAFQYVEENYNKEPDKEIAKLRNFAAEGIWNATEMYNTLNSTAWLEEVTYYLQMFQANYTDLIRSGYDIRSSEEIWTYPGALMYCLSVFSMIGYGNTVPKTPNGKVLTMVYATFGIPLYILYFQNMGKVLASTFRWLYTWFHDCSRDQDKENTNGSEEGSTNQLPKTGVRKKTIVPSTACLWVFMFYIAGGTIMFKEWENWEYYDSVYFVVISLCKIGFGDMVPGSSVVVVKGESGNSSKLVINFVFILFGMGLVAMCYKLMREEVLEKFREMKEDAKLCMEDISQKFAKCFGGGNRDDDLEEKYI